jgi:hypothetical protein
LVLVATLGFAAGTAISARKPGEAKNDDLTTRLEAIELGLARLSSERSKVTVRSGDPNLQALAAGIEEIRDELRSKLAQPAIARDGVAPNSSSGLDPSAPEVVEAKSRAEGLIAQAIGTKRWVDSDRQELKALLRSVDEGTRREMMLQLVRAANEDRLVVDGSLF